MDSYQFVSLFSFLLVRFNQTRDLVSCIFVSPPASTLVPRYLLNRLQMNKQTLKWSEVSTTHLGMWWKKQGRHKKRRPETIESRIERIWRGRNRKLFISQCQRKLPYRFKHSPPESLTGNRRQSWCIIVHVLSHFLSVVKMVQFCSERESVYFVFLSNFPGRTAMFTGGGRGKTSKMALSCRTFCCNTP